jgi:hypothetical protein
MCSLIDNLLIYKCCCAVWSSRRHYISRHQRQQEARVGQEADVTTDSCYDTADT